VKHGAVHAPILFM